jgi:hypothetical protein
MNPLLIASLLSFVTFSLPCFAQDPSSVVKSPARGSFFSDAKTGQHVKAGEEIGYVFSLWTPIPVIAPAEGCFYEVRSSISKELNEADSKASLYCDTVAKEYADRAWLKKTRTGFRDRFLAPYEGGAFETFLKKRYTKAYDACLVEHPSPLGAFVAVHPDVYVVRSDIVARIVPCSTAQ